MEFTAYSDGFIMSSDEFYQKCSWNGCQNNSNPSEFNKDGISLKNVALQYIENGNLLVDKWMNVENHLVFKFINEEWLIQQKDPYNCYFIIKFKNPSDELKLKIMNMILQGCDLWLY